MGYREEYGPLLESIVQEGDVIAMRYFRAVEMRVDRKGDGSAVDPSRSRRGRNGSRKSSRQRIGSRRFGRRNGRPRHGSGQLQPIAQD